MSTAAAPAKRRVWLRLSIATGNIVQAVGLVLGAVLIEMASASPVALVAILEMLLGWGLLYLCCHAIAHWLIGRLLGIRFRHYTIGGTSKPQIWPWGLRWVFAHIPFFGVQTEGLSMQKAAAGARAAMWAAGVTSSAVVPIVVALWAWQLQIPWSRMLFLFCLIWSVGTVWSNFRPGGDYFKARQALREGRL